MKEPRKKQTLAQALAYAEYPFTKYFWPVSETYRVNSGGGIAALDPAKGNTKRVRSSGHVKPTRSDFIADVEKAVKAVLPAVQFAQFISMSLMNKVPDNRKYWDIEDTAGREFLRRGIYPLSIYFKDVYCVPKRGRR